MGIRVGDRNVGVVSHGSGCHPPVEGNREENGAQERGEKEGPVKRKRKENQREKGTRAGCILKAKRAGFFKRQWYSGERAIMPGAAERLREMRTESLSLDVAT